MHKSVTLLHSCNKSQSHIYLEFVLLPEEYKQGKASKTGKIVPKVSSAQCPVSLWVLALEFFAMYNQSPIFQLAN